MSRDGFVLGAGITETREADGFVLGVGVSETEAAAPPVGAIMDQFQNANLGADLFDGTLL